MREFLLPGDFFDDDNPLEGSVEPTPLPEALPRTKAADNRDAFRGTWDKEPEGQCRVRIPVGEEKDDQPVMILTKLNDNPSTNSRNHEKSA
jgi:hypothetical protein